MVISEGAIRLGHTLLDLHNSSDDTQPHSIITSAEREVKDSQRSGMYQSYHFLTRLATQSL